MKRRWRRGVAFRVLASYFSMMMAFAVTLGWSVLSERRSAAEAELLSLGYVPLKLCFGAALQAQNLLMLQLNHITEMKNPSDARSWIETQRRVRPLTFADVRQSINAALTPSSDRSVRTFGELLLHETNEAESFIDGDGERFARLFDALLAGDVQRAEALQNDLVSQEVEGARRIREVLRKVDREMDDLISEAKTRERRALQLMIVMAVSTFLVGGWVTLYTRRVLKPLAAVTARAHAVAEGDLTPRAIVPPTDEIGELLATFEGMVAAIARANSDLVQAERLATIGKMAAHVTHEIRNPLSSMGLNIELLEEEVQGRSSFKEAPQLVRAIKSEIDRLTRLSEEYLSLARRPNPRLERENLSDLVRELLQFVKPELDRARVHSSLEVAESLPPVAFDEAQIRQALLNLIRNAREAMQPQGGILEVALLLAPTGEVELRIGDTGIGIAREAQANVFDPFFTTKQRGTGLGLSVTRQIVEAHGGTIVWEPRLPRGTRFCIRLPASPSR